MTTCTRTTKTVRAVHRYRLDFPTRRERAFGFLAHLAEDVRLNRLAGWLGRRAGICYATASERIALKRMAEQLREEIDREILEDIIEKVEKS